MFQAGDHRKPDDAAFDHQTDQRRKEEGQWQGDGKRPVEQPRIIGADHLLHHESDIGAQHNHFAMRHVDDAHDAKGNSKADGRKQQDGTERKTVPDILSGIPESLPLLDMSDGAVECLGKFRLRIGARRIQDRQCGTVAIILQELRRLELVIERAGGCQKCCSLRLLQKCTNCAILFLTKCCFNRVQCVRIGACSDNFSSVKALRPVCTHQRQPAKSRSNRAADRIVDLDLSSAPLGASPAASSLTGSVSCKLAAEALVMNTLPSDLRA